MSLNKFIYSVGTALLIIFIPIVATNKIHIVPNLLTVLWIL